MNITFSPLFTVSVSYFQGVWTRDMFQVRHDERYIKKPVEAAHISQLRRANKELDISNIGRDPMPSGGD